MRVEFLRDWKWFKKGQYADLTRGRADLLIKRKLCQPAPLPVVKAEPVAAPVKAEESPEQPKRRRKNAIPKPQAAN